MHLRSLAPQEGSPSTFLVDFFDDAGTPRHVFATGAQLDQPLAFATFAAVECGSPCTSPVGGDAGAWHAALGSLLARRKPAGRSTNDAAFAATPGTPGAAPATMSHEQREAMLKRTALGQTILRAEAAEAKAESEKAIFASLTAGNAADERQAFLDRIRKADAESRAAASKGVEVHLGRSAVGRDALRASGK